MTLTEKLKKLEEAAKLLDTATGNLFEASKLEREVNPSHQGSYHLIRQEINGQIDRLALMAKDLRINGEPQ